MIWSTALNDILWKVANRASATLYSHICIFKTDFQPLSPVICLLSKYQLLSKNSLNFLLKIPSLFDVRWSFSTQMIENLFPQVSFSNSIPFKRIHYVWCVDYQNITIYGEYLEYFIGKSPTWFHYQWQVMQPEEADSKVNFNLSDREVYFSWIWELFILDSYL